MENSEGVGGDMNLFRGKIGYRVSSISRTCNILGLLLFTLKRTGETNWDTLERVTYVA
jgi:hypothetical protein